MKINYWSKELDVRYREQTKKLLGVELAYSFLEEPFSPVFEDWFIENRGLLIPLRFIFTDELVVIPIFLDHYYARDYLRFLCKEIKLDFIGIKLTEFDIITHNIVNLNFESRRTWLKQNIRNNIIPHIFGKKSKEVYYSIEDYSLQTVEKLLYLNKLYGKVFYDSLQLDTSNNQNNHSLIYELETGLNKKIIFAHHNELPIAAMNLFYVDYDCLHCGTMVKSNEEIYRPYFLALLLHVQAILWGNSEGFKKVDLSPEFKGTQSLKYKHKLIKCIEKVDGLGFLTIDMTLFKRGVMNMTKPFSNQIFLESLEGLNGLRR
jgi:hypothetical protein